MRCDANENLFSFNEGQMVYIIRRFNIYTEDCEFSRQCLTIRKIGRKVCSKPQILLAIQQFFFRCKISENSLQAENYNIETDEEADGSK